MEVCPPSIQLALIVYWIHVFNYNFTRRLLALALAYKAFLLHMIIKASLNSSQIYKADY